MGNDDFLYTEYKMSRDSIQLVKAYIINCHCELVEDLDKKMQYTLSQHIFMKQERISEKELHGNVKTEVTVSRKNDNTPMVKITVECKGIFNIMDDDISREEEERRLNLQLVPQLLPYIRSSITSISAMMNIPPVILPTIDIIKSIKENR